MDLTPFSLPNKLMLSAGPTNCSDRVLRAISLQGLGPMDKDVENLIDETREFLKMVFCTKNKMTFAQQTSGSGGLEAIIVNLAEPGQKIIVAIGGVWGERAAQMAEKYGIEVVRMSLEDGEVYTLEELEREIKKHKPVFIFMTHGESSTGVLQPLVGLADICHRHNCLLAVDAIITIGSDPLLVDDWKLDAVVGASQKGIGAPPGFALLTFSPLAEKVIMERKTPVPFYLDAKGVAFNWNCSGDKRGYYYTFSSNMIAALREALAEKLEEGLENVWQRHRAVSESMWEKMESIGVKHFVKKKENRLHSVSTYVLPDDIKWQVLLDYMYDKYQMSIGFGVGPTTNKAIRLGIMGVNSKHILTDHIAKSLKEGIDHCRKHPMNGPTGRTYDIFK